MLRKLCLHVRGNAVAYVALFFALAGGAYASGALAPANSVNSQSIINGQVKQVDLANGAVSGSKVASNSLTGAQINESSLGIVPKASLASNASDLGRAPASSYTKAVTIKGNALGPTATTVLSAGGLKLTASCHEYPAPSSLTVNASSSSGATFAISYLSKSNQVAATPNVANYNLTGGAAAMPVLTYSFANTVDDLAEAGGTFVYTRASGATVTGSFEYFVQNAGGECDFLGNAVPSPAPSP